ncbi:MAG TPA: dimethyladenosine transferase [Firmicutes bacterium]|jgi:putative intracellular protease/amidase|nr:dimethyladenosine transferase [Bacillota bacterium]
MDLLVLLFNEFETLDAFGPVEVLGKLENIQTIRFISIKGGTVTSSQQVPVVTTEVTSVKSEYILLVPGGAGVRYELNNPDLLNAIKRFSKDAKFILSVCTGSALLAKAGILDEKEATTNKRLYDWVTQQGTRVKWIKKARWVKADDIYTSSGVSAGIDMSLGFIADNFGIEKAEGIARTIEYVWNQSSGEDVFAGGSDSSKSILATGFSKSDSIPCALK